MSSVYIPDWAAQEELNRWDKKFPTGLVRVLVKDKLSIRSSHTKVKMYRAWLESHPYTDEERADMVRFLGLHAPRIQLVEVNGPMEVIHHFTEVEEDSPKSEWISSDHPGLGEVQYRVNNPSGSTEMGYVVNKPFVDTIKEAFKDVELIQEIVDEAPCFTVEQINQALECIPEDHFCAGQVDSDELIAELMRGENHDR